MIKKMLKKNPRQATFMLEQEGAKQLIATALQRGYLYSYVFFEKNYLLLLFFLKMTGWTCLSILDYCPFYPPSKEPKLCHWFYLVLAQYDKLHKKFHDSAHIPCLSKAFFFFLLMCFFQVRREKISERMKMLQKLVPGCEKVETIDTSSNDNNSKKVSK